MLSKYLCGFITHASRSNFGGEKYLFAWDARSMHCIGARLLISVGASRVNVAVTAAEGMESDRFGDLGRSIDVHSGTYAQSFPTENGRGIPAPKEGSPKNVHATSRLTFDRPTLKHARVSIAW
jgi:hypothetical protein